MDDGRAHPGQPAGRRGPEQVGCGSEAGRGSIAVTVIVPVLNGANLVEEAVRRIRGSLAVDGRVHEIVLVDDGSSDDTWATMVALAGRSPLVEAVRLQENVGQAAATAAGIGVAHGRIVVTTDVDLETDPDDLGLLVDAIEAGADLASGRRSSRRKLRRELPSRLFNLYVRSTGIAVRDIGCGSNALEIGLARRYAATLPAGRNLPKAVMVPLAEHIAEVPLRSRRPEGSQIGTMDLITLWIGFDRRVGRRPDYSLALVAVLAVGAAWRGPGRSRGPAAVVAMGAALAAAAYRIVSLRCHPGARSAPVVIERTGPNGSVDRCAVASHAGQTADPRAGRSTAPSASR